MLRHRFTMILLLVAAAMLVACRVEFPATTPTIAAVATVPPPAVQPTTAATEEATIDQPTAESAAPTAEPTPTVIATAEPTAAPTAAPEAAELPAGVYYDLGEAIVIQDRFPADSRFREMPVRLNGVIAVPDSGEGPFPVVLILHGTHPGCPVDDSGVDRWPCDPELEQDNYAGFEYLVRELAARGYVALSININAENTFGFGEPLGGERLDQIVDLHLSALAEAAAGGDNGFGVPLAGVPDMRRLALFGHSRGGEFANWLAGDFAGGPNLTSPTTYASRGYGPVNGLLLIAPAMSIFGSEGTDVPLAIIISGCDGDLLDGVGQGFYEAVRLGEFPNTPATSVVLDGANHNGYNTILSGDMIAHTDRPDCVPKLDPAAQQQFLVDYAADFLTTIYNPDPTARLDAATRLGIDPLAPAPAEVMGRPALVSSLAAGEERLPLFIPAVAEDMTTNLVGGAVVADGVTTHFCEGGYSVPATNPGSEPCGRPTTIVPGYPYMAVVGWEGPGGALRFELPEGTGDLSRFTTISLRAVVDPLSPLNTPGEAQRFSIRLTDGSGATATVATRPDEPALAFPIGDTAEDAVFGTLFSSLVPMTTIRLPLAEFGGVDLADVAEIALVFDQTESGNLFVGDLELVRPPHIIGAYSTLLENADGANAALSGVARFNGATTCTGVFVAPVDIPAAPAYLLTNGHCAQQWDANQVLIDQPPGDGWAATFNFFADTAEQAITMPAVGVAYSTMKGRDVAFVELDATVGELMEQGIIPLGIASAVPEEPFEMRVIGAPITGVPAEISFLREERCRAGGSADLFEFIWHFNEAITNTCQDIYGGSSGSPVFAGDDPAIIGLITTTNIGGLTPCGLGTPCEVGSAGTTLVAGTSYATPVVGLSACFDANGVLAPAAPDCPLDDGRQLLIAGYAAQGTQNPIQQADGSTAAATWNATLSGELPYYRYKIGRAGEVDCRQDVGYGAVISLAERAIIDDELPAEEGSYVLCVLAGESEVVDGTWQTTERTTVAHVMVDNTPPEIIPHLSIMPDEFGGYRFEPIFAPPELSHFEAKFGPAAEVDCAGPAGFQPYRRFPFTIPAEQIPARVCIIGYDAPGNAGQVFEVVVGEN